MKILHVITALNPGGAEGMLYRVVKGLSAEGVQSTVVSLSGNGLVSQWLEALPVPVFSLCMHRGAVLQGIWRLSRLIRTVRPDIVQTWMYHADLFGGVVARLAGARTVVWNVRGSQLEPWGSRLRTRLVVRACAALSRRVPRWILSNSEVGRTQHIRMGYPAERFSVIPNGYDIALFRPNRNDRAEIRRELGIAEDVPVVGMVARYHPMKDHANLISAATRILKRVRSTRFVLCGEGVTPENRVLSSAITAARVGDNFHLVGRRADMPRVMNALDMVVSASAFGEGFSNVIGEAMACGVPCVVTDVGDSAAIVGDTGVVVPPQNAELLSEACLRMIELDAAERRRLGERARKRIADHYSMESILDQYYALYERLLSSAEQLPLATKVTRFRG